MRLSVRTIGPRPSSWSYQLVRLSHTPFAIDQEIWGHHRLLVGTHKFSELKRERECRRLDVAILPLKVRSCPEPADQCDQFVNDVLV